MSKGTIHRDEGIVLRTYKLGEADRIIVFLTRRRGKVRAVAKGVRKTRSKFGSRLEPMSHVALQLYEGRELDLVTQVDSIDHFRGLRDDLDQIARASAMLETADQLAQEGAANPRLYEMLLGALRTLDLSHSPLVVPAFFWKVLALEGYRPEVDHCVMCGEGGPTDALVALVAFDLESGGLLCHGCRRGTAVSAEAVELLQQILGGRLNDALSAPPSPASREVDHLATRAVEHHLERRLRSVTVLDR
ncbi:MAG: DNA repair protein RecO [Actinobacteria bacterium]|uniref:DNA repair protein RecO n=1 Tax=freshwater metagenome TaxID=449393 RepID=A0A6J7I8M4_9ZZZZ|nr:DNA repair protein RecO [Actinomycetota bacterium]